MWKICSSTAPTKTLRIQLFWKLGISYIDNIFWNLSETFFYNGTILLHIASLDSWVHEMSFRGAFEESGNVNFRETENLGFFEVTSQNPGIFFFQKLNDHRMQISRVAGVWQLGAT